MISILVNKYENVSSQTSSSWVVKYQGNRISSLKYWVLGRHVFTGCLRVILRAEDTCIVCDYTCFEWQETDVTWRRVSTLFNCSARLLKIVTISWFESLQLVIMTQINISSRFDQVWSHSTHTGDFTEFQHFNHDKIRWSPPAPLTEDGLSDSHVSDDDHLWMQLLSCISKINESYISWHETPLLPASSYSNPSLQPHHINYTDFFHCWHVDYKYGDDAGLSSTLCIIVSAGLMSVVLIRGSLGSDLIKWIIRPSRDPHNSDIIIYDYSQQHLWVCVMFILLRCLEMLGNSCWSERVERKLYLAETTLTMPHSLVTTIFSDTSLHARWWIKVKDETLLHCLAE